jgi:hypothetical protein
MKERVDGVDPCECLGVRMPLILSHKGGIMTL